MMTDSKWIVDGYLRPVETKDIKPATGGAGNELAILQSHRKVIPSRSEVYGRGDCYSNVSCHSPLANPSLCRDNHPTSTFKCITLLKKGTATSPLNICIQALVIVSDFQLGPQNLGREE